MREPWNAACEPAALRLRLLDGFELLCAGVAVNLQPQARRVLAFLALSERPVPRSLVASTLWLESSDERAQASLRTTLWRLRQGGRLVVERDCGQLQLAPGIDVDVRSTVGQARRLLTAAEPLDPDDERLAPLRGELLVGWWDEWVLAERERLRQLQLHALERLSERLLAAGRVAHALDAALSAVAVEPLRESAQRLVIAIHLSEGNQNEALRQYVGYRRLLEDELGVAPSPHMARLLAGVPAAAAGPVRQSVTAR